MRRREGLPAADASGAGDERWRDSSWVLKERPVDSLVARTRGVRCPGAGDTTQDEQDVGQRVNFRLWEWSDLGDDFNSVLL